MISLKYLKLQLKVYGYVSLVPVMWLATPVVKGISRFYPMVGLNYSAWILVKVEEVEKLIGEIKKL